MKQDDLDKFLDEMKSRPEVRFVSAQAIKTEDKDLSELERRAMKRMTARINSSEYIDNLINDEIIISKEMRQMLYSHDNYLDMRQLGPRPEDMLYLGDGSPSEEE